MLAIILDACSTAVAAGRELTIVLAVRNPSPPPLQIMLKGLTFSELQHLMASIGEKPDRAEVLSGWLYHSGRLIRDIEEAAGVCSTHGDHLQRYRVGRQSRENIRAIATADGGLELEVGREYVHALKIFCKRCWVAGGGEASMFRWYHEVQA